jgi:hypothetical protein
MTERFQHSTEKITKLKYVPNLNSYFLARVLGFVDSWMCRFGFDFFASAEVPVRCKTWLEHQETQELDPEVVREIQRIEQLLEVKQLEFTKKAITCFGEVSPRRRTPKNFLRHLVCRE